MVKIDVRGDENLTKTLVSELNEIIKHYIERLERKTDELGRIDIKIKTYSKKGNAHQYSINIVTRLKTRKFEADAMKWDFNAAVREAFNKILTQMNHKFRDEF